MPKRDSVTPSGDVGHYRVALVETGLTVHLSRKREAPRLEPPLQALVSLDAGPPQGGRVATDVGAVLDNLLRFYRFGGKALIAVGAGGGQFAGYGKAARIVTAVDPDPAALEALAERVRALGIEDRFVLVQADFMALSRRADVVLFEFALHEITDPAAALAHAESLAPDIIIMDHAPGSPWAHVVDETDKVAATWDAVAGHGPRRGETYDAVQRFASYTELFEKVRSQGAEAVRRIERWRHSTDITIPMRYRLALLGGGKASVPLAANQPGG